MVFEFILRVYQDNLIRLNICLWLYYYGFYFKICVKRFYQNRNITKGDLPPDDNLIETGISTLLTTLIDIKMQYILNRVICKIGVCLEGHIF